MKTAGPNPTLSAIMIVKDGARFIGEAIASVQSQSFSDWELIVADDGSIDATPLIVAEFARQDSRIRMIRHAGGVNRGMSASRNLGLAEARGEFVAFLDADDVWLPAKSADQLTIMAANPDLGMTYGRVELWHSWCGKDGPQDQFRPLGVEPDVTYAPQALLPLLFEGHAQTPTTCGAMMRRAAALQVGGFVDRFSGFYEDRVFFARMLSAFPCYVDGRCVARYRQHNLSATAGRHGTLRSYIAFHRFLIATRQFLAQNKVSDREILMNLDEVITGCRRDLVKIALRGMLPSWLVNVLRERLASNRSSR